MRKGGGKHKGNKFQREVSKLLSAWITNGEKIDVIAPSASSGGQATHYKKRNVDSFQSQQGDLQAIEPEGKWLINEFYFELKSYKDLSLDNFLIGKIQADQECLSSFWRDTVDKAKEVSRTPCMIVRVNYKPELLLVPLDFLSQTPVSRQYVFNCDVYLLDEFLKIPYTEFVSSNYT